jgi:site-specific recombinase XerD
VFKASEQMNIYHELKNVYTSLGILWLVGCSSGFRVSDLLALRAYQSLTAHLSIVEAKTGKRRDVVLPPKIQKAVQAHVKTAGLDVHNIDHFLFCSSRDKNKPMTRQYVHCKIREIGENMDISDLGTHSMRKTYAYNFLLLTKDFAQVRDALNHTYMSTTFLYLVDGLQALLPLPRKSYIEPATFIPLDIAEIVT